MKDFEDFLKWVLKVHPNALIICPDYGVHRFVDRMEELLRRWKKEYGG